MWMLYIFVPSVIKREQLSEDGTNNIHMYLFGEFFTLIIHLTDKVVPHSTFRPMFDKALTRLLSVWWTIGTVLWRHSGFMKHLFR